MNINDIYKKFPTEKDCFKYLEKVRWKGIPNCPYCGSKRSTPMQKENRHHCNNCNTSYSVTVNTIFHDTRLSLQKWFLAIIHILNTKKELSARQLAKNLNVNKNTGWYLTKRIKKAIIDTDQRQLLIKISKINEVQNSR